VNIDTRTYTIPAEERGNKSKTRVEVPICAELWARVFEPRLACRESIEAWVIPSAKHPGQPARSTRSAMEGLRAATGVKVSPHICRRTFASLAQQATRDPLLVARMLTHSVNARDRDSRAPLVTAGYIHYEEDALRRALDATAALLLKYALQAV
jgi:integrase